MLASSAYAQDYKVSLIRPDKIGDEYANSVTARVTRTYVKVLNGEEQDESKDTKSFTAACKGTVKVLAVDDKGKFATRIRYQVDSLTKNGESMYPEGTVIIAKLLGSEVVFEIDGSQPDAVHAAALAVLLGLGRPNGVTNEDPSNGTDKPLKIGDTWPVNATKTTKQLGGENSLEITADELKGESKLVDVKDVDGQKAMVIKSNITADGFKKELPDGGWISDGKITSEINEVLPVDEKLPAISLSTKMSMTITMNPHFGSAKSIVRVKSDRKERRAPVTPD
jgi:hypothetical protein